jgi:DNA-binding CsgD family transcriptional regulator
MGSVTTGRLRPGDARALLQLCNHIHDLPANPIVRHECMLRGLCRLTDSALGVCALLHVRGDDFVATARTSRVSRINGAAMAPAIVAHAPRAMFVAYTGCETIAATRLLNEYLRNFRPPDPAQHALLVASAARGWRQMTRSRAHLVAGDAWYHSAHLLTVRQPLGVDDALYSVLPLAHDALARTACVNLISLGRRTGSPPFGPRERQLLHVFHGAASWLYRSELPHERRAAARLSPREGQILRHLLTGDSEKQIAHRLNRSRHTVHTYVKAVYRNLGASTRGELLSMFL